MALCKISNRLFSCAYFEEKVVRPDRTHAGKKVYAVCDYCLAQLVVVCDWERKRELRCPKCGRLYEAEI